MKLLLLIEIVFTCVALSSAALFRGYYNDPEYPGKCVMKDLNLILSPGDEVSHPSQCTRLYCYNDSQIEGRSCSLVGAPEGCEFGERLDAAAPYPECCHREIICKSVTQ